MAPDNELDKKERKILLTGAAMGIIGGMLANMWANFYFKFIDITTNSNFLMVTVCLAVLTVILAIIIFVLIQDIKQT